MDAEIEQVSKQNTCFIKSEKIERITGDTSQAERDAYLEAFARELNEILDT